MKRKYALLFSVYVLVVTATAIGADPMRERFRNEGIINSIDATAMSIGISDGNYRLSPATRVYNAAGQPLPISTLKKGSKVRYNLVVESEGGRTATVNDIVVMPTN